MDARDVKTMQSVLMRTVEGYHSEAGTKQDEEQPRQAWSPSSRTLH